MIIHLTIDRPTPSPNLTLRMHWREQRRLTKTWDIEVLCAINGLEEVRKARFEEHRDVKIIRYGRKLLDPDNLVGSTKMLIDALRHAYLIWDDNPKCLDLIVEQKIDRKRPRTEIFIIYGGLNGKE